MATTTALGIRIQDMTLAQAKRLLAVLCDRVGIEIEP